MARHHVKKWILIAVFSLVAFILVYVSVFAFPYAGKLKTSGFSNINAKDYYSETACAERVMCLDEPYDSFLHRLNIVELSEERLCVASYATHKGKTTNAFFYSLILAAERGVKVRILLDAKFGGLDKKVENALLATENIELYEFNALNFFKPHYLNVSLHDKYLVADGKYMLFGGRNIGDKYYAPSSYGGAVTNDREVLIYNTDPKNYTGAIGQVNAYFDEEIASKLTEKKKTPGKRGLKKGRAYMSTLKADYDSFYADVCALNTDYAAMTQPTNKITLIRNPIEGTKKEPVVAMCLAAALKDSERTLIQSPYTVLTRSSRKYLSSLVEGKEVKLLTNSLSTTPNLPAFSNYTVHRQKYLDMGLTLYEYQHETDSVHVKTWMFDARLVAVGSFNLDERSIRIDTESMLMIDSTAFAAEMGAVIGGYELQSIAVDPRTNDYVETPPRRASGGKKALYSVTGWLLNPFAFLL